MTPWGLLPMATADENVKDDHPIITECARVA